jgi:ATP-dependent helicase/nuclease subunit A
MPDTPTLTPHQVAALTGAHHLCVTANAGSGKTLVLVERYFHLVADGHAAVKDIVALTFTEKAASELKRKIAERVDAALRATTEEARLRRLESFRSQLPGAVVGTIHSFCALLLREYPVEADVDAAFGVVEGLDKRTLLDEAVSDTFHSLLRGAVSDPLRDGITELVAALGKRRVVGVVTALVEKREQLMRWTAEGGLFACPDGEVLARWDREIEAFLLGELESPLLNGDLDLLLACGAGGKGALGRGYLEALRATGNPARKASAFREFLDLAVTKGGSVQKSFAGSGDQPEEAAGAAKRLARWRNGLGTVLSHVARGPAGGQLGRLLSAIRLLCGVAQRAVALYDQRKQDAGQLDFEDLEIRARALLKNGAVRAQLAGRFRFVMVDEYQDTNRLQYDILLPLLQDLAAGNLFIVGDPKQSIYGFRNADVTVFLRTRKDLIRVAGSAADVVLDESFRPLRDVAAFVNTVFGRIMGGGAGEIRYDPLVRARQNGAPGSVELLLGGAVDGDSEADRIARRVLQIVTEGHTVYDKSEGPHGVRFRDIALLLRSRIMVPEIEEAFLHYRIPYVVSAGVGYFQTQDILDFHNYCMFLLNPSDDAALTGILRSPFFGVSDAELFEWSLHREGRSLWGSLTAAGGAADATLREAVASLREDVAIAQTVSVPELLARIVRRRLYTSKLAGTARGPQALANLEKLQRIARSFDALGFSNLYDFAQRLRRLIDEEEREGQGAIESEGDAVQVMTIHAAKGLEFPVVVIPRTHRAFLYDREPLFDDAIGVAFALGTEDDELPGETPILALLKERNRRKVVAEEKRIFYVAATRARDMLILSGSDAGKRGTPTYFEWLMAGLGGEVLGQSMITVPVHTATLVSSGGEFTPGALDHDLVIPVRRAADIPAPSAAGQGEEGARFAPPILLGPVAGPQKPEIFSATRIRTYLQCPAKYYLRYVLGFPEGTVVHPREDDEIWEQSHPGEIEGSAFHAVMEQIEPGAWDAEEILRAAHRSVRKERPLEGGENLSAAARIAALVGGVLKSPFWSQVARGADSRAEYTMTCPLGGDYIMGTVDRVFRDPDGALHIVDYKTDALAEEELESRAREYFPQIDFYAFLASKFFGVERVRGTLLFAAVPQRPVHREYSGDRLKLQELEIASSISSIKSGRFEPREGFCDRCPFHTGVCEYSPKTRS